MDIHFEGQITRQDFYKAHVLHNRPTRLFGAIRLAAAAFFVLAFIFTYSTDPTNWQPLVLLGFPVIFATSPWWMPFFKSSSYGDKNNPLKDPIAGISSSVGIVMSGPTFKSSMRWDTYTHHKVSDTMALLYMGRKGFNFFPRSLFKSDHEWETFLRTVTTKTSPVPQRLPQKTSKS